MGDRRCDDALERIYVYLDGELGWFRRAMIRRHLRRCNGCNSAFSFEDRLKAVVRERLQEEPPADLVDRLQRFLREQA